MIVTVIVTDVIVITDVVIVTAVAKFIIKAVTVVIVTDVIIVIGILSVTDAVSNHYRCFYHYNYCNSCYSYCIDVVYSSYIYHYS